MERAVTVNNKSISLMLRKECTKARQRRIYTAEPGETAMEGAGGGRGRHGHRSRRNPTARFARNDETEQASTQLTNKQEIQQEGGRNRGDEKKATDRPMKGDPPG